MVLVINLITTCRFQYEKYEKFVGFVDIDECATDPSICADGNAVLPCVNTYGNYTCLVLTPSPGQCSPFVHFWQIFLSFKIFLLQTPGYISREAWPSLPRRNVYGHARLCVYLSVCPSPAFPHYCTDTVVTNWRNDKGVPSSCATCALLGGFAIGVRVSLL